MLGTAMALYYTSAGTHQEIDQAWILNQKSYVGSDSKIESGPFGMMDYVGLNVVYDGTQGILKKDEEEGLLRDQKKMIIQGIANNLKEYIERGDLGIKTGKGFYSYPDPEFLNFGFMEGATENKDLSDPIINAILKQSILLVADGICDVEDVDLSWMLTHSPAIGPFGIMDDRGIDLVSRQLKDQAAFLEAMFGKDDPELDELKRATDYLDDMIQRGETGKKSGKGFYSYPNPAYARDGFIP